MEEWVEEVLFRGRPPSGPDSEKSPLFHVVIGVQVDDPLNEGQKLRKFVGPFGSAKAAEMGYTPLGLVEQINQQAFQRVDTLEAEVEALRGEKAALEAELEALRSDGDESAAPT